MDLTIEMAPYAGENWYNGTFTDDTGKEFSFSYCDMWNINTEGDDSITWTGDIPENSKKIEEYISKQFSTPDEIDQDGNICSTFSSL